MGVLGLVADNKMNYDERVMFTGFFYCRFRFNSTVNFNNIITVLYVNQVIIGFTSRSEKILFHFINNENTRMLFKVTNICGLQGYFFIFAIECKVKLLKYLYCKKNIFDQGFFKKLICF